MYTGNWTLSAVNALGLQSDQTPGIPSLTTVSPGLALALRSHALQPCQSPHHSSLLTEELQGLSAGQALQGQPAQGFEPRSNFLE